MSLLKKDSTVEKVALIWVLAAWATLCVTYEAAAQTFDAIRGKGSA